MNPVGKHCAYQKLDSGIREFIFLEKSPAAVDEWLQHIDGIILNDPTQEGHKELLLLDARQHVPSLMYAARKVHAWRKDYDPNDANTRAAILLDKQADMVMNMGTTLIRVIGLDEIKVRFFTKDRQKAIDWLLSER